jgi:hypothetical protein
MAEKRMFSLKIIDADAFTDMPATSQNLYFHLAMRADDEGFINRPKSIAKTIGANDNDFDMLVAKGFLIGFESKIFVIKHWWMHNYIRSDRVRSTSHTEEKELLELKENGTYTLCQTSDRQVTDKCQASIEEIRLDKVSLEESNNVREESPTDFDLFWKAYPKKVAKDDAIKMWKNKKNKPSIEIILQAVERYKQSQNVLDGYVSNPATWINKGRWSDEFVLYQPKQTSTQPKSKLDTSMETYQRVQDMKQQHQQNNNFIDGEIA